MRLILTERGEDAEIGGDNVEVTGTTSGGEVIKVLRGDVTFDASFNRGGDTIILAGVSSDYLVRAVGTVLVLEGPTGTIRIPAGAIGMELGFANEDGTQTLAFDTSGATPVLKWGSFVITSNPTILGDLPSEGSSLTEGVETLYGTEADDFIRATERTLNAGDVLIDEFGGSDTLEIRSATDNAFNNITANGFESVVLISDSSISLNMTGFSSVQSITIKGSGDFDLDGVSLSYDQFVNLEDVSGSVDISFVNDTFERSLRMDNANLDILKIQDTNSERTPEFVIDRDSTIQFLSVQSNVIRVSGSGDFEIANYLIEGKQSFNVYAAFHTGNLKINGVTQAAIGSLSGNDEIIGSEFGEDRLVINYGRSFDDGGLFSGFERISVSADAGQAMQYTLNDLNAPSDFSEMFFQVYQIVEADADGFGLQLLAGETAGDRSYEVRVFGSFLADYIVVDGVQGDSVYAGRGDDIIVAGSSGGNGDRVLGEEGDDTITLIGGNNYADGGAGDDLIVGGSGLDQIFGGSGNDDLSGGGGNDRLDGQDGTDILNGGSGNDWLEGGKGNDTIITGSGADTVFYSNADIPFVDTVTDFSSEDEIGFAFDMDGDGVTDNFTFYGSFTSMADAEAALADGVGQGQRNIFFVSDANGGYVYVDLNDDGVITDGVDFKVYLEGVSSVEIENFSLWTPTAVAPQENLMIAPQDNIFVHQMSDYPLA
ncbi:calcium-binding protein [Sphingomicrobium sp. XHP0239]|uniref:calcium-binding protein n=1 Tax=Sphingomicrobium maritimum TaxID=3133972 RepID=UPI0031CC3EE0